MYRNCIRNWSLEGSNNIARIIRCNLKEIQGLITLKDRLLLLVYVFYIFTYTHVLVVITEVTSQVIDFHESYQ